MVIKRAHQPIPNSRLGKETWWFVKTSPRAEPQSTIIKPPTPPFSSWAKCQASLHQTRDSARSSCQAVPASLLLAPVPTLCSLNAGKPIGRAGPLWAWGPPLQGPRAALMRLGQRRRNANRWRCLPGTSGPLLARSERRTRLTYWAGIFGTLIPERTGWAFCMTGFGDILESQVGLNPNMISFIHDKF